MKWYHFALLFCVFFAGLIVMEQQEEITEKLWEQCRNVEKDCLTAAVNAATEVFFSEKDMKPESVLLENVSDAFFQTLSFLYANNTDVTGTERSMEKCILLAILDEDGYVLYCRREGGVWQWSEKIGYKENGTIPELFFETVQKKINAYKAIAVVGAPGVETGNAMPGIWEKGLSAGCVFAVYCSEYADHFTDKREGILYAAAKKVTEEYPVTQDMVCHLPHCRSIVSDEIVAVFESQKQAAKYGAAPCSICMAWEKED